MSVPFLSQLLERCLLRLSRRRLLLLLHDEERLRLRRLRLWRLRRRLSYDGNRRERGIALAATPVRLSHRKSVLPLF